jgi:hypothetical protein
LCLEVFFDDEPDIERFKKYDKIFLPSIAIKLKDYANDPTKKRAVWYATANLIELKDEVIIPKSKVGKNP